MVVEADPALVLTPLEDAGQRGKIDFAFAQVVIAKKKCRVLGACFVHHSVGKLDIFPGKRVLAVYEIHEDQAVIVFFEELDDVGAAQIEMNRVGGPVEALWVGQLQHQFDLVLTLDQLALRVIVESGANTVFRAQIAQVVVIFAGDAQMLSHDVLR